VSDWTDTFDAPLLSELEHARKSGPAEAVRLEAGRLLEWIDEARSWREEDPAAREQMRVLRLEAMQLLHPDG
jgi:hypothetical protein